MDADPMPAISFQAVEKKYHKQVVLNSIDLDIQENEFFGLVGMNGAGKTTLMKSMLDFVHITSGTISLFGLSHLKTEARACLSFLPEKFIPPYYLTGRDYIQYMQELQGVTFDEEETLTMFQRLDLQPKVLEQSVGQFSKGMSQKLGLAACFLSGKDLLLLDEPMSGLDPRARARLKQLMMEMKAAGKTLFFSTHLLTDVEELCDRIAILHDGVIQFCGSPAACCQQYGADTLENAYLKCIGD